MSYQSANLDPKRRCPVLILNYNGWDDTIAGLAAMRGHVADLWLIDNGSPVDRLSEVAGMFPEVRLMPIGENLGYAGAYNRAVDLAAAEGAEAVYILNNDAALRPGALDAALATLTATPDIAAVGSMMLDQGGRRVFFDGGWHFGADAAPLPQADLPDDVIDVRQVHGGGFALKIAAWRHVGPFHPDYFLYHEEADWCARAHAAGWRLVVDRRSRVDHEGEGSNVGHNSAYYMARNRFLAHRRGILLRDRKETALSIAEYEYLEAAGRGLAARVAITNGLIDGFRGRFGPRRGSAPALVTITLAAAMPWIFRARRKLAYLAGRS